MIEGVAELPLCDKGVFGFNLLEDAASLTSFVFVTHLQKYVLSLKNYITETTQLPEVSHSPAYLFLKTRNLQKVSSFSLLLESWGSLLKNEIRISCLRKLTHLFILSLDKDAVHILGGTISSIETALPTASLSEASPKCPHKIPSVRRLLTLTLCCRNHCRPTSTFVR